MRELSREHSDHAIVPTSGEVKIGPLPAGRYLVRHAYRGEPPFVYGLDLGPIDLAAGEDRDFGTHTLATPNALDLVLRRTDGAAIRRPSITLTPQTLALQTGAERRLSCHLDDRGRLWPRSFTPGRYRLHVDAGLDHDAADLDVEILPAHTTEHTLTLAPRRECHLTLAPPVPFKLDAALIASQGERTPLRFYHGRARIGLHRDTYAVEIDGATRTTFTVDALVGPTLRIGVPAR